MAASTRQAEPVARPLGTADHEPVDVLVVGGGPAGCASALALRRAGRSVVLVERSGGSQSRVGEVLPPLARPVLEGLGLLERFHEQGHLPAYSLRCDWGRKGPYEVDFTFHPYGPGWHLNRRLFDEMLLDAAQHSGVCISRRTWVRALTPCTDGQWQVEVAVSGRVHRLTAAFVIDATGRAASIARKLGAQRQTYDSLLGLVAELEPNPPGTEVVTLIEAGEAGWWYAGRLPGRSFVAALMTDADLLPTGRQQTTAFWQQQLESTALVSTARPNAPPVSLRIARAGTSRLDRFSGPGWLAAGEAAMAFDPLSGQGICAALEAGSRAGHAADRSMSGDGEAIKVFAEDGETIFRDYLQLRGHYYQSERRWDASTFWRRRHEPLQVSA